MSGRNYSRKNQRESKHKLNLAEYRILRYSIHKTDNKNAPHKLESEGLKKHESRTFVHTHLLQKNTITPHKPKPKR